MLQILGATKKVHIEQFGYFLTLTWFRFLSHVCSQLLKKRFS